MSRILNHRGALTFVLIWLLALWAAGARAQVPNPTYSLTLQDAVTGDATGGSGPQNFTVPGVTCVNCRIPDPNPPAGSGPVDNYTQDVWERPTQSGSSANVYFTALDIVTYEIGFDSTFLYFRMRLFGVDNMGSGKRLPFFYAYEINFDADPRGDLFVRSEDPSGKGLDDVFGTPGVIAFHDSNNNVGDGDPLSPDGPGANVDGYESLVFDQGTNNVPGQPSGSDAVRARTILIGGIPYIELAVERVFLDALNGGPVAQAAFRPYASKGGSTTGQNTLYAHDQYGRLSAGSPYPWLQQAGAPATCPNTNAADDALTTAQRNALNSGTNAATAFPNPCYPSGGNLVEFDNAGTVNDLASGILLSFTPPTVAKSFTPATIGADGVSTLTITLTAANTTTVTGVSLTDLFPSTPGQMVVASPLSTTNTCGGTLDENDALDADSTLEAGDGSVRLTGGTIPGSGGCTITVQVTAPTVGSYTNSTGPVSTSNAGTATAASATLTVLNRPAVTKSFSPDPIASGGTATLTIVLSNINTVALSVNTPGFTDTFPTTPGAMTVASPLTTTNTCGGTLLDNAGGALAAGDPGIRLNGGSIPAQGSCQVTVNVTATTPGTHTNSIAAGNLSTSGGTNVAAASDTLTVNGPAIAVVKSSVAFSDPYNNTTNPKRIPGGFVDYSTVVTNSGAGAADNNSTIVLDPIPAGTDLFVGDLGGAGSGPVAYTQGTPTSGLTYTFTSLASSTDDLSFSNDGGATFTYTPVPNGNGVDPAVTHLRINPKGVLAGDAVAGAPSPNFTVSFRMRVE
jgi:hypothetical protein